jgi:hypothetical protein
LSARQELENANVPCPLGNSFLISGSQRHCPGMASRAEGAGVNHGR